MYLGVGETETGGAFVHYEDLAHAVVEAVGSRDVQPRAESQESGGVNSSLDASGLETQKHPCFCSV